MEELIKKIEESALEYYQRTRKSGPEWMPPDFHHGMDKAEEIILDIIREFAKTHIVLEEITEEDAKKSESVIARWDTIGISETYTPNYQVVEYDGDADGWVVEWVDCLGVSQCVMYSDPAKFYRLPQAKEEK